MTCNSASRSYVHQCITCCSSNLLSWDWWLWKAEMIILNIDVHHLYWFILEIYEKCPRSWLKKSAKHLEFFLSPKVHFAFSLIFKDLQLKTMKNWTPPMLRHLKFIVWSIFWALDQSFWLLELQAMTLQSEQLGHFWHFFNNLEIFLSFFPLFFFCK